MRIFFNRKKTVLSDDKLCSGLRNDAINFVSPRSSLPHPRLVDNRKVISTSNIESLGANPKKRKWISGRGKDRLRELWVWIAFDMVSVLRELRGMLSGPRTFLISSYQLRSSCNVAYIALCVQYINVSIVKVNDFERVCKCWVYKGTAPIHRTRERGKMEQSGETHFSDHYWILHFAHRYVRCTEKKIVISTVWNNSSKKLLYLVDSFEKYSIARPDIVIEFETIIQNKYRLEKHRST